MGIYTYMWLAINSILFAPDVHVHVTCKGIFPLYFKRLHFLLQPLVMLVGALLYMLYHEPHCQNQCEKCCAWISTQPFYTIV